MNKAQLIATIAEGAGLSNAQAEKALSVALDGIVESLIKGEPVAIVGFGSFGVKSRSARKVRNPQTGEDMLVKATTVPYFKAGKNLKETVDTDSKK
jgi:DNA-binding protein HU-beta